METVVLEIVIEKEPADPGYFAYSEALPGCFSNGPTAEQALLNMSGAIKLHVQSLLAHGDPLPFIRQ